MVEGQKKSAKCDHGSAHPLAVWEDEEFRVLDEEGMKWAEQVDSDTDPDEDDDIPVNEEDETDTRRRCIRTTYTWSHRDTRICRGHRHHSLSGSTPLSRAGRKCVEDNT